MVQMATFQMYRFDDAQIEVWYGSLKGTTIPAQPCDVLEGGRPPSVPLIIFQRVVAGGNCESARLDRLVSEVR